ncbi:MAG TPA: hypothetical protein VIW64_06205 [Pyrinomonadaceae bacterium]|jgi:hypothetical protein
MNPLQPLLRILIITVIFFLIFILVWLFYCRCYRRGAIDPNGPYGTVSQPLHYATAQPNRVEGGKYPAFTPLGDENDRNNEFAYPVPDGPLRGTLAPTANASQFLQIKKKKEDTPLGGAGDPVVFTDYDPLGTTSNVGSPPDMNAARGGNVALLSYNSRVQLTTDGAVNWAERDPTTIFPSAAAKDANGNNLDRGFCCDQIIQYVPKIDRFIWLMQFCGTGPGSCLNGINKLRIASASPQDIVNSNLTAWTYWDLSSATFNLGNTTMDYPEMSVGDNFLYLSSDAVASGLFVVRIPLNEIQNSQTINMGYTDPANGLVPRGGHISQNTSNEVFWAGHNSNSQMRVFSMKEGDNQYFWRDININSWNNGAITSTAPDGTDWLSFGFPGNAVLGITRRNNNEVWFAWSAKPGNGFQNTHVQVVEMNVTNYSVISQWQIWNNDYAFAYPSLATNENGEVGISLAWGGKKNAGNFFGNHAVGILGDFVVWYPELSDAANPRWGDYVSVRRNSPNGRLYDASGYAVLKNGAGKRSDPYYIQFGRDSVVNGGAPDIK